jgi:nitrite reductase (NADH) small subunit
MRIAKRMLRLVVLGRRNGYRARLLRRFGFGAPESPRSETASAPAGPAAARDGFVQVVEAGEVEPGRVVEVIREGMALAVANVDGTFFAIDNTCPHAGGPLGDGQLDGHELTCPCHGWSFDVRSGACLTMDEARVGTHEVRRQGDVILARL